MARSEVERVADRIAEILDLGCASAREMDLAAWHLREVRRARAEASQLRATIRRIDTAAARACLEDEEAFEAISEECSASLAPRKARRR